MGTCTKLSHQLLDLGFFSALGTTEHAGPQPREIVVKRSTPMTTSYNNGVRVIYDEEGRPWIAAYRGIEEMLSIEQAGHKLTQGAYVPHSNDGGCFVREVLPKL